MVWFKDEDETYGPWDEQGNALSGEGKQYIRRPDLLSPEERRAWENRGYKNRPGPYTDIHGYPDEPPPAVSDATPPDPMPPPPPARPPSGKPPMTS